MAPLTSDIGSIPQPCGTILIHLFSNQVMPDMTADSDMLGKLASLAGSNPQVQVLWLYGSRAKGTHGPDSDWDLAVAFYPVKQDGPLGVVLENRLRPELLALEWQRALGLADGALSVLDINQAPIPLAFAVVAANHLLYSRDEGRRRQEEARIMSRQEIDFSSAAWANCASNESSDNAYISALRISL